ncbi:MAG: diguanylate cyclase (GGDEF)-like protein/PAS domain S-box-containing protein, partial [Enterobacterales bacterium]
DTSYKIQITGSQELSYPEAKENFIMFPKLNPGDYSLSVIAINPTTGKSSAPAKLTIKVKYAPFASPTAYSIYFLLSILLISIWNYRRRLQRQRLLSAHQNIMENQERLQLALKGSNSGEFDWHCDDNLIFEHRIHDELGHEELPNPIPFKQHLDLVHPDDIKRYKSLWQAFTNHPDKKFECIYRLRNSDNSWQWYRDLARVASRNADGTAERITGAYTNITNTRGNEEKARLFGEAFKQTRDWVAILDKYGVPITTNKAFYVSLGISKDDLISSLEDSLGLNESRKRYYRHVFQTLKPNGHWQGETLIVSKTGNKFPSLIKMNAISADGKHIDNYVIIMTDISEQKAAEEKLKQLAHFDSLTGLPNRLFLLERIEHAINNANRNDNNMAVLFIDLDRFKQINDSLGHEVGDIVLKTIAQRLRNILRKSDTVARLGGDEFVVLLESFDALEHITRIAEKIINGIDEPLKLENSQIRLSPSIGISLYPDDAKNSSDLIKFADVAMYHSKEVGGRSFRFFNESMNQHAKQRFELENKIKQAHLDNEFINYYQPIVDTNSEKIVGFELLLRWQSKEGLVSPAKFISIAEEIALIIPMTITALNQGLADLSLWHKIDPSLYLSVNLAARHLEQMSLVDDVIKALQKSNIHSSRLRFEITEGTLMKDHKKSIQTMMELNKIGVELYLDDFGTGYSSLQYLKRLPINVIKIDRSFIKDIGIDENNEAIVEAILLMANSLKKYCIAEGVETKEQLHFMIEHDCNLIQGYIFSKPLPVEYIAKLLERKLDFS